MSYITHKELDMLRRLCHSVWYKIVLGANRDGAQVTIGHKGDRGGQGRSVGSSQTPSHTEGGSALAPSGALEVRREKW
jgi:hypothetical protein